MVTSAASPSAPSAAALNEVAIEKKMTVPPSAVARIAPPSQPGTSTHTMVRSAGPPAAATASRSATGSRASQTTHLVGETGGLEEVGLRLVGYDGDGAPGAGATSRGQAERPGLAGAADDHDDRVGRTAATWRSVSAGAPQTSITARASGAGRSSGSFAAMLRPNRIA